MSSKPLDRHARYKIVGPLGGSSLWRILERSVEGLLHIELVDTPGAHLWCSPHHVERVS